MVEEAERSVAEACRNCGHVLDGPFCSKCGQAEHDGHPPTLGHFFHDLVHEFLHVDGTIFRTLKALFVQPGKLTEEYWAGRVVSWVRPIRLFLIIAAIHLLLSTGVGPTNLKLQVERDAKGKLSFWGYQNDKQLAQHKGTFVPESERREIAERLSHIYASVRYGAVLVLAFGSWLLYRRQQPYFVSHLIAGLHFYSFWYVLAIVESFFNRWNSNFSGLTFLSVIYLFLALRRLFPEHWAWRLVKTIVLFIAIYLTELSLYMLAAGWVLNHP